jgi:hypothetical protein
LEGSTAEGQKDKGKPFPGKRGIQKKEEYIIIEDSALE